MPFLNLKQPMLNVKKILIDLETQFQDLQAFNQIRIIFFQHFSSFGQNCDRFEECPIFKIMSES